ncbi:MAG: hypothetical protein R2755_02585 [Acidimicrobiales bacterium]
MTDEQLIAGGVGPDLIRLSVGIEDLDDICRTSTRRCWRRNETAEGGLP